MLKLDEKYICEFLGTFALVFLGAGAVVVDGHTGTSHGLAEAGKLGLLGIAVAHGLTLTAVIYGFGPISGGHFNPAITLAAWVRRRIQSDRVLGYVVSQLIGALVAALVLSIIFPDEVGLAQLGTPALGPRISSIQGFAIEAAITFLLTVVVLTSVKSTNHAFAGLAIGGTLTGIILFAGPLTGAAANPARYLGPALVSRNIDDLWLYLTAPFFGAGLGAFVIGFAVERPSSEPEGEDDEASDRRDRPETAEARGGGRLAPPAPAERRALEADASDAEPASAPQPDLVATDDALRTAQELYWGGDGKKAVAALLPLVVEASTEGRLLDREVRSLIMVIEDGCGRLDVLDRYRHLIGKPEDPAAAAAQAPAPAPSPAPALAAAHALPAPEPQAT